MDIYKAQETHVAGYHGWNIGDNFKYLGPLQKIISLKKRYLSGGPFPIQVNISYITILCLSGDLWTLHCSALYSLGCPIKCQINLISTSYHRLDNLHENHTSRRKKQKTLNVSRLVFPEF
ncbi:hypothetical protein RDI58_007523 [Solanum bulbocastanum]|uniref:Uncharacterized protein n=1 Tax=Solanum bulbocastanum TaxID=147425 RepID=A0AAN8TV51_SOLBU